MIDRLFTVWRLAARLFWQASSLLLRQRFRSAGKGVLLIGPKSLLGLRYVSVGDNFSVSSGLRLEAFDRHNGVEFRPEIIIGNNVSINHNCHIAAINRIEIGHGVLIASDVYITDHSHGAADYGDFSSPPSERRLASKGPVRIEDNVWIGEKACILPGTRIGRNSIVGAGAIVTRDVPPGVVVGGVPARILKRI